MFAFLRVCVGSVESAQNTWILLKHLRRCEDAFASGAQILHESMWIQKYTTKPFLRARRVLRCMSHLVLFFSHCLFVVYFIDDSFLLLHQPIPPTLCDPSPSTFCPDWMCPLFKRCSRAHSWWCVDVDERFSHAGIVDRIMREDRQLTRDKVPFFAIVFCVSLSCPC
jgi:hypothetical protein